MKLSERINIFSKATAYKIITHKSVALFTDINAEKEVIKSNSIIIAPKPKNIKIIQTKKEKNPNN